MATKKKKKNQKEKVTSSAKRVAVKPAAEATPEVETAEDPADEPTLSPADVRREIARLHRENKRMRQEIEILEKFAAFVEKKVVS